MTRVTGLRLLAGVALCTLPQLAGATDVEVTHWWTSGGEAAAVKELASAYEAKTGNHWVDGAIAGSGGVARPIIISRILGGDPMAATQLNHGKQAQELIEAGLLQDITDVAEANHWRDIIKPASLLDACTVDGKIYCVPIDIHSTQWLWTSPAAAAKAGLPPITSWEELKAAAPKLREAGILPLALGSQGWQANYFIATLLLAKGGDGLYYKVYRDRDQDTLEGPEMKAIFDELATARTLSQGTNVQDWNLATAKVIADQAAAQLMGDWAQGEFALAGRTAGTDYDCFIDMGEGQWISTGGDAIYFPLNKNPEITKAQKEMAQVLVDPEVQVAFNLKKGALPIRGDVDMSKAGACMKKGLQSLADGKVVDGVDQLISPDAQGQSFDLMAEFFGSDMSPETAQKRFADILRFDM